MKHTPLSAAKAIRAISEQGKIAPIAVTWTEYFDRTRDYLKAYDAGLLVKEQANCTFRQAMRAVQRVMPELFANGYWETLPMDWSAV